MALHRGVTAVNLTVPHVSGARPPAILLSLTRAGGRCSVARYSYIDHERRARFRMWIRCPRARRGARVKLVFRAPLQRRFRLRNGVGTVRVVIDKPRGTALPMGRAEDTPRRSRLPRHAIAPVHGRPPADGDGPRAVPWSAGERTRRPHGRRTDRSRRAGRHFEVVTDGERRCECGDGVHLPGLRGANEARPSGAIPFSGSSASQTPSPSVRGSHSGWVTLAQPPSSSARRDGSGDLER